ncbi:hypothetical protein [Microbacterium proteolyticum]|uniref:hypothetical protein n=1 Tax=Microbacterium proteolyticum TaxID=1572644 RepID=UPI001FABF4D4|nr:hypothetical protein [Microbacterium proteolyticum]MCI9858657.1 hypothetical protein [Microbacterium proteolyticum]
MTKEAYADERVSEVDSHAMSRRAVVGAAAWAVPAIIVTTATPASAASTSALTLTISQVSDVPVGGTVQVTGKYQGAVRNQMLTLSSSDTNVTLARKTFLLTTAGTFSTTASVARVKTSQTASITALSNGLATTASLSYVFVPVASITVNLSRSFSGDTNQYYINVSGTLKSASGNGVPYRTVSVVATEGGTWRDQLGGSTPDSSDRGSYTTQLFLNPGGARTITFTVSCEGVSTTASISIAGS